jgi:predicted nucleic acid-binding protein
MDVAFEQYAQQVIIESDILLKAASRIANDLRPTDALHVACAMEAEVDFLITTDDEMLKYKANGPHSLWSVPYL